MLEKCLGWISASGYILISVPNIRYYRCVLDLVVKGKFEYKQQGILDITHLRFFTLRMMKRYLADLNFKVVKIKRNFSGCPSLIANAISCNIAADFFTRQYIILAQKR